MEMPECDLIMKGGIASGVVYPPAIQRIGAEYRFRGIGGSSAGAIAAALAAAMEHGRQSGKKSNSLAQIGDVDRELQTPGHIRALFPPQRGLIPLYWTLTSAVQGRSFPGMAGQALLGLVRGEWEAAKALSPSFGLRYLLSPGSLYGCCTGMPMRAGEETLTPWMYGWYQKLAGLPDSEPLTFAKLAAHDIDLRMITTDVSARRPITLPTAPEPARWRFHEEDFRRLFPEEVVKHLIRASDSLQAGEKASGAVDRPGLHWLPTDGALPVIVAVRMSLSFPVLLAAILLYDLEGNPHWFSDGGISNNFPIQLFDSWLSSRPTFALNLIDWKREGADVWRDAGTGPYSAFGRRDVRNLIDLVLGIAYTAQSAHDDRQSSLPGYRERVVQIFLTAAEGGLNLDMDAETLRSMQQKGIAAGAEALAFGLQQQAHRQQRLGMILRYLDAEGALVRESVQQLIGQRAGTAHGAPGAAAILSELQRILGAAPAPAPLQPLSQIAGAAPASPASNAGRLLVVPEG